MAKQLLNGNTATPKSAQRSQSPEFTELLEDVIEKFCREKVSSGEWSEKTEFENRAIYELLIQIIGNLPVNQLDHAVARSFKNTVQKLPPNIKKHPRYRELTIDQILATNPSKTMAVNTVNKALSRIGVLFGWMNGRHGYISANYFARLGIKNLKRPHEERSVFSEEDLQRIFAPQDKYLHDYYRWIHQLGLLTGARVNELAQLYVEDIYSVDEIPVIDINDKGK